MPGDGGMLAVTPHCGEERLVYFERASMPPAIQRLIFGMM